MNENYEFKETDRCDGIPSYVELQNDFYIVTVYQLEEISMIACEPKDSALELKVLKKDYIRINDVQLSYIDPQTVPKVVEKLNIAAKSAEELQKALLALDL